MRNFRFHLVGLAHLPASKLYNACAYTQKILKLSEMLMSLGHQVVYYGSEGSGVVCSEFVPTHTVEDIRNDYGDGNDKFAIGYDYKTEGFREDLNSKLEDQKPSTRKFYLNCSGGILARKRDDDFLLLMMGAYHQPISMMADLFLTCEPGIGYRGSFAKFRAFESHHLRSFMQGKESKDSCYNGDIYDRVIPNYFDPNDFTYSFKKENYVLYLGRMHGRKGVRIAYEAAKKAKVHLKIAGQGGKVEKDGSFSSIMDPELKFPKGDWEYLGYADIEKRRWLLSRARALLVPTQYMEPFAGVHIEAMISGTPPITSDFGVFPGTITDSIDGELGFRCNTLNDYVNAIEHSKDVYPPHIRSHSQRYFMENVKYDYQKWFEDLYDLYLKSKGGA